MINSLEIFPCSRKVTNFWVLHRVFLSDLIFGKGGQTEFLLGMIHCTIQHKMWCLQVDQYHSITVHHYSKLYRISHIKFSGIPISCLMEHWIYGCSNYHVANKGPSSLEQNSILWQHTAQFFQFLKILKLF